MKGPDPQAGRVAGPCLSLPLQKGFSSNGLADRWYAIAGLAALAIPTLFSLGKESWSTEAGAHGPIVLATGLWLFWVRWNKLREEAQPAGPAIAAVLFLIALPLYVFGRAYDFLFLEAGGLFGAFAALFLGRFGWQAVQKHWFLLFYMAFLIPAPGWALDEATQPLKQLVSQASTAMMRGLGVPVFREGVTLYIGPYQLLVEDACAGMNSLMGLISISLFYIYVLRGAEWRYALLLAALIVPVAVMANMVRISLLVLLTWGYGDAVAQGFLHFTAGFLLFALALLLIFGLDWLLSRAIGGGR